MTRRADAGLVACALACPAWIAASANAQSPLDPVTITATRSAQRSFDVPASIDVVGVEAIRTQRPGVNLAEALGSVPGIHVQNRQNFAQDLQVSSASSRIAPTAAPD